MKEFLLLVILTIATGCLVACEEAGEIPPTPTPTPDPTPNPPTGCADPVNTIMDGHSCKCETDCLPGAMCLPEEDTGEARGFCLRLCNPAKQECSASSQCDDVAAQVIGDDACTTSCQNDNDCTFGEICRDGLCCMPGVCRIACTTSQDCPQAQVCARKSGCFPMCQSDSDCLSNDCNPYTTLCDGPTEGAGIHAPCLRHDDCKSLYCNPISKTCYTNCSVERQGCPEGAKCIRWVHGDDMGICFHPCETSSDCTTPGLKCFVGIDGTKFCAPPAKDEDCEQPVESIPDAYPCNCDDECMRGAFCAIEAETSWPKGACLRLCDKDNECRSNCTCRLLEDADTGYCSPKCESDADCPDYRVCFGGSCRPLCQADTDCTCGKCNVYSGYCGDTDQQAKGITETCTDHDQCKSQLCSNSWGRCLSPCSIERQGCPDEAVCVAIFEGELYFGICLHKCVPEIGCEDPGLSCTKVGDTTHVCI